MSISLKLYPKIHPKLNLLCNGLSCVVCDSDLLRPVDNFIYLGKIIIITTQKVIHIVIIKINAGYKVKYVIKLLSFSIFYLSFSQVCAMSNPMIKGASLDQRLITSGLALPVIIKKHALLDQRVIGSRLTLPIIIKENKPQHGMIRLRLEDGILDLDVEQVKKFKTLKHCLEDCHVDDTWKIDLRDSDKPTIQSIQSLLSFIENHEKIKINRTQNEHLLNVADVLAFKKGNYV